MIRAAAVLLFALLPGWTQVSLSSEAPMPAAPPLVLPKDDGQHPKEPFERWTLRGVLQASFNRRYGVQVLFARGASSGDWHGSEAWRSDRWWVAQASLLGFEGHHAVASERLGREGLAASGSEARLDLQVDGWTLTQDQGLLRLHLRTDEGALDLELKSPVASVSLPPVEGRPLYRSLRPLLRAQGRLDLKGQGTLQVWGRFTLVHEWGSVPNQPWIGWNQALFHFADGRTWLLDGGRIASAGFTSGLQLLELDVQGRLTRILREPPFAPIKLWMSPASGARYPTALRVQAWKEALTLQPLIDDQECRSGRPGATPFYRGFATLQNAQGTALGDAFLEETGYALPFHTAY